MSAPKSRCVCRMPRAECVCDDESVTDATGAFLKAMLGPGPREADGPPYVHVHQFPEEPEDEPPPEYAPFAVTITEDPAGRPEPQVERE